MPRYLTQKEAFMKCKKEGMFIITEEIDIEMIKSSLLIADAPLDLREVRQGLYRETMGRTGL